MPKALIVSDNTIMASAMEIEFHRVGWSSNCISVNSIMGRDSASVCDFQCITLVVDMSFRRHFGGLIEEMGAMVRNCSKHTPLYLVFEGDYDPAFASWLEHTKRLFKSARLYHYLWDAVHKITRLESCNVPKAAFVSPMGAI